MEALSVAAKEAADVNNDGSIAIDDVISVLRDIAGLERIATFDLVDASGVCVKSVGSDMSDSILNLTQNSDVDLSGSFLTA